MDRQTIYAGQIPLETDLLKAQQNAMVGQAAFSAAVFGTPTLVDAFTVTPTTPASLNVILTPGSIYQLENLESTTWSSVLADISHTITKQGVQLDPVTFGITPPGTVGYSQVFLVEVQYQDLDTGSTVLPYYNAANPSVPFSGPGNDGAAQNTVRKGIVASQVKAGIAAPTGTQATPSADAGWTGLYTITVANGATTITAGNINKILTAPFLQTNGYLPQIPTGVQYNSWDYCVDTGAVNAMVGTIYPVPQTLTPGLHVWIKVANTNTGPTTLNLNGLGAVAVHRANGAVLSSGDINAGMVVHLIYDGTAFQVANFEGFTSTTTNNNTNIIDIPYATDTGTTNVLAGTFNPAVTSYSAGLTVEIKVAHTNTGACTLACNGLSAQNIVDCTGQPLVANMLVVGEVALLIYDGTNFQLANRQNFQTQSFTLYVDGANGSDTLYDGSQATVSGTKGPFATLQKAFNVAGQYPPGPNAITIQVAAWGSHYAGARTVSWLHPPLVLNGAGSASTTIDYSSGQQCSVVASNGNQITVQNCTIVCTAGTVTEEGPLTNPSGLGAMLNGTINLGTGVIFGTNVGACFAAVAFGTINVNNNFTISGNIASCFYTEDSGFCNIQGGVNCTISAPITLSGAAFAISDDHGTIQVVNSGTVTFTNPNNVTGSRYFSADLGIIETAGGGANFFPGTVAGTTSGSALYN